MRTPKIPVAISVFLTFLIVSAMPSSVAAQCGVFFSPAKPRISPVNGKFATSADMNGDGRDDLVGLGEDPFNSNNRQQFFILPGDGTGGFGAPILIPTRPGWWMESLIIGDFDNDTRKDVMVRFNQPARDHQIYRNNGDGTFSAAANPSGELSSVQMQMLMDVNGDGKGDLVGGFGFGYRVLFGNGDGTFPTNVDLASGFSLLSADFNGDGRPDFINGPNLLINDGNGAFTQFPNALANGFGENPFIAVDVTGDGRPEVITLMLNAPFYIGVLRYEGNGVFSRTNYPIPIFATQNSRFFAGNFGGNDATDLVLVSPNASRTAVLINDGTGSFSSEVKLYSHAANVAGDFDGDGKTDLMAASNGRSTVGFTGKMFPEVTTTLFRNTCTRSGQTRYFDMNATGYSDFAFWNPADGSWYARSSNTSNFITITDPWGSGSFGDVPAPGDFDGDGKTDRSVFRDPTGTWWIQRSSDGGFFAFNFGLPGDRPAVGDYDGDKKSDIAVWRPSDGIWYIWLSGPQQFVAGYWGLSGDKPVPADYDGDGKTDLAVYRPSTGIWYVLRSGGGGFSAVRFGLANDHLIPADYDGDGSDDIAIYRSADRTFHMLRSSNGGYHAVVFGTTSTMIPFGGDFNGDQVADLGGYEPVGSFWRTSITGGFLTFGAENAVPMGSLLVPTP